MTLNKTELATVLAALRMWQTNVPESGTDVILMDDIPKRYEDYFDVDSPPMQPTEIDDLCERLNFDEGDFFGYVREDFEAKAVEVADVNDVEGGYAPEIVERAWQRLLGSSEEAINDVAHQIMQVTFEKEAEKEVRHHNLPTR